MRKTSHDGADSSSITSGKDNETKKITTSFNKMTKSSIKRKVQNFSQEIDDGIIEPLLQTEKEKIEIANRSAKYLLNKSKTESLHEKDSKFTDDYADKCSTVPIPISSTSNVITNNVNESSVSTSYICGSAPIHNHMNTNTFNAETSIGLITTKSQILVEIDNSKPGTYNPSSLIFTTAKIHTDSKTKLMEPVQVTPVPILSTIEGNTVKAGVVCSPETSSTNKTSSHDMKVLSVKSETNVLQNDKTLLPTVAHSLPKYEALNENVKKPPTATSSLESSTNLIYKDIKLGQLPNTVLLPVAAKLASNENMSLKEQPIKDVPTNKNISTLDKVKPIEKLTGAGSSKNSSETYISIDKSKERFHTLDNIDSKILQEPLNLQNQENTHKIILESPEYRKMHFTSKNNELMNTSVTSNKKLQRQKNASNEETNNYVSKIVKTDSQSLAKEVEKNYAKTDKEVHKIENSCDFATRVTLPIATKISSISKLSTAHPPKGTTTPCVMTSSSTEIKTTSTVSASTPKVKSITETVNLKPTLTDICKDVPKSLSKSSAAISETKIKDSKEPTTTSTIPVTTALLSSNKLPAISLNGKSDILSSPSCSSQPVKTDPSIKYTITTVNTTLPSYIVSTSKTKIGSTMPSNTPATALKAQIQKPCISVNTTSACVKSFATPSPGTKTLPSTSASNGTKHNINFSKQTKSKAETIKKEGRT